MKKISVVVFVLLSFVFSGQWYACSGHATEARRGLNTMTAERHSLSIGYETLMDDDANWTLLRGRLDKLSTNTVYLSAGRAEWVTFSPWEAHPDSVADSDTDHLGNAISKVKTASDGSSRNVALMIDAFIPEWIKSDPSVAGVQASGKKNTYTPSASALLGEVGDRYEEVALELVKRHHPYMVTFTELSLDATFGSDDFALYKSMTGSTDWPRNSDGSINERSSKIGAWRSNVMAKFYQRVVNEVDAVSPAVKIGADVAANWANPAAGRPDIGHDYMKLLGVVDRLVVWGYFAINGMNTTDVTRLTAGIASSGVPVNRVTISIGLWSGEDESQTVSPKRTAAGVRAAETNGITGVNLTPYSRLTSSHIIELNNVW